MRGDNSNYSYEDDLLEYGLTEEQARKILGEPTAEQKQNKVFPENWIAAEVFLASTTQWRFAAERPMGLDYASVESIMRIYSVKEIKETFEKIRIMELAALEELNRKK